MIELRSGSLLKGSLFFVSLLFILPSFVRGDEFDKDRSAGSALRKKDERLKKKFKAYSSSKIKGLIPKLKSWRPNDRLR
ncbi:MAG: hypothetical protein P1V97_31095, partial [Planctomycetota bacterium]|nr:hypothetical protein [Planctomycetota bacterium]